MQRGEGSGPGEGWLGVVVMVVYEGLNLSQGLGLAGFLQGASRFFGGGAFLLPVGANPALG